MLIDSHCHFDISKYANHKSFSGFDSNFHSNENILERARKSGITHILAIGTDIDDSKDVIDLVCNYESKDLKIYAAVGIHPDNAKNAVESIGVGKCICKLEEISEKAIAIGEFGLDYRNGNIDQGEQFNVFDAQMNLAKNAKKPVVIHSRCAEDDTISVLQKFNGAVRGIIHCFSGSKDFVRKSLDLGYYISFSGIITFKNASELREIARNYVPKDMVLVETDAPFLAPSPYRGKINEPAYVIETAKCLANEIGVSFDEICEITSNNFFRLFGL